MAAKKQRTCPGAGMGFVYLITNSHNGKKYVGQTRQAIEKRWIQHCCPSSSSSTHKLQRAIAKYGPEAFVIEVLEEIGVSQVNEREVYWIEQHYTFGPSGYNLTTGGSLRTQVSEETKQRIREHRLVSSMAGRVRREAERLRTAKQTVLMFPEPKSPRKRSKRTAEQVEAMRDRWKGLSQDQRRELSGWNKLTIEQREAHRSRSIARMNSLTPEELEEHRRVGKLHGDKWWKSLTPEQQSLWKMHGRISVAA